MSGHGKRRLSLETLEEPSIKRQRLEEPDAKEAFTNGQVDSASYPTYMGQPQATHHSSATPSQHVFHPQATPSQPIHHPQATPTQHVSQPQHVFQPPNVLQPQHLSQPQPVHGSQPVHVSQSISQPPPVSGINSSRPRPNDEAADTDSDSEDDNEPEKAGPSIQSQAKGKRRASSPAPEEPSAKKGPSARSQKRAGMKNPGRDDRERDEVGETGGQLFWRDPKTGEWRKVVYHNDIRAELIAAASALGAYTHQRKRGTRAHDETAFHPEQRDWAPERQHCKFCSKTFASF